jgi:DNA polymerase-4
MLVVRPPRSWTSCTRCRSVRLWGVGPKTEEVCSGSGCGTVGDLAHVPAKTLQRASGAPSGSTCTSWPGAGTRAGWSRRAGEVHRATRRPFGTDIDDPAVIHRELLLLSERTAAGSARAAGWPAR